MNMKIARAACALLLAGAIGARADEAVVRSADELHAELERVCAARFPENPPGCDIPRAHAFDPEGTIPYRLVVPSPLKGGRNWFQLCESGRRSRAYLLRVDLYWEDSVWVATRALPAGTQLDSGDLTRRLARHTQEPGQVDLDGPFEGLCVSEAVGAGEVITRAVLRQAPMVARGDLVRLVYRRPGLLVSSRAEVLEDGAEGESIRVRPLDGRKVCQALVKGAGEVEVIAP